MKVIDKVINKVNYKIEEFDSVLAMVNSLNKRAVNEWWNGKDIRSKKYDASWTGVESIEKAYELLKDGWTDELKKMDLAIKGKVEKNVSRNKIVKNYYGYAPNVPLALMGVPKNMFNKKRVSVKKSKVMSIIYDNGADCSKSSDDLIRAGSNLLSVIKELELKGYRCELKVMNSFCDVSNKIAYIPLTVIKDAGQTLNLRKVMFPMAHSAWLRVIGFEWQDKTSFTKFISQRGKPFYSSGFDRDAFSKLFKDTIYLNYNDTENIDNLKEKLRAI